MESTHYDQRYLQGISYFNECEFFEAHEVWEELWADYQGPSRKFYQGLIQAAVALHHFGNGNLRGAKKLFFSSSKYLAAYEPHHEGIDLVAFLRTLEHCFAEILAGDTGNLALEINPERIPEIHLQPPPQSEA